MSCLPLKMSFRVFGESPFPVNVQVSCQFSRGCTVAPCTIVHVFFERVPDPQESQTPCIALKSYSRIPGYTSQKREEKQQGKNLWRGGPSSILGCHGCCDPRNHMKSNLTAMYKSALLKSKNIFKKKHVILLATYHLFAHPHDHKPPIFSPRLLGGETALWEQGIPYLVAMFHVDHHVRPQLLTPKRCFLTDVVI